MIQHEFEELLEQFSQDELNEKSTVKGQFTSYITRRMEWHAIRYAAKNRPNVIVISLDQAPRHLTDIDAEQIVFAFLLCILSAFPTIEVYLKNRSNHFEIHLELKNIEYLRDFVTVSRRLGLRIDDIESNPAYVGSGLSVYTITVTICSSELKKYKTHHEIIEALKSLDYIYHLEELR